MELNKEVLFTTIKKLKKVELIELLDSAFINMDGKMRRHVFGEIYKNATKKSRTGQRLLADIEQFYTKSINGHYYAPFMINSKNFSYIPEETDEWFDEISDYLDFTSQLVNNEKYKIALRAFNILFELIDRMGSGEEIVFADELGDWMLVNRLDYIESYIIALTKSADIDEYVKTLIPLIKTDSYLSFSQQVFKKAKKHASKAQMKMLNKEIKLNSIRTK